jgi:hypothetical protein
MSSYWDAVARAALGLAGTAEPRPRSIFESDNRRLAFDDADRLDDASMTSGVSTDISGALTRAAMPVMETPPNGDGLTSAFAPEIQPDERLEVPPSAASQHRTSEATPPDALPPPRDPDVREVRTERVLERVEVTRFETIHTIAEPALRAIRREESATPPAPAVALPTHVVADDRREEASASLHENAASPTPIVVVAEPSRAISEPPALAAAAHEAPPLVIEIDHIDIRIESATPVAPAAPRRREREAAPSLDDYLQRRSEGRR